MTVVNENGEEDGGWGFDGGATEYEDDGLRGR